MSGPRHPGTEGNDLWPADIKFPDPDGGDGRLSLVNDVAAEFSGLAISSTQPTDMPDGGLWVNLSADATAVDRLSTYDASTDVFIPIQADSTVVQDSEPAHSKGLIWFDSSPEDGFDMFFSDGEEWYFLQSISEIPDGEAYKNQDTVRAFWDNLYETTVTAGDVDLEHDESFFENEDFHPLEDHRVGEFNGDNDVTHGEDGRYKIEDREDDGFFWITSESESAGEDLVWFAGTDKVDFGNFSEIEIRYSNDDTGRGTSGIEIGVKGHSLLTSDESNPDTQETLDISDISGEKRLFIVSIGTGTYDEGTRASATEVTFIK